MSSTEKSKKQRRQDTDRTLRPKLRDFKRRRTGEEKSKESATNARNISGMAKRGGMEERRSLRTRRMDSIFDDFRNSIESMMNPSFSSWGYFPSSSRLDMENEVRTPMYDMVDDGDKYKLIVELPGIDKDNIHVRAMDDSIEISAEQSQEEDKQKKDFVYNQRIYSIFLLYNSSSRRDFLITSYR